MEQETVSTIIEALKETWQKVLGRSSIGVDDDFFVLGGDPKKATILFGEIARAFERTLPPVLIYVAPTIRKMSEILASPTNPALPAILPLKQGTPDKAIFLVHGLGGNALEFFDLVKHLQIDRAVYGTQAKGTDGLQKPAERIEEMASYFLEGIRKLQPHGPYSFIGYSLGGLVALEMARQLKAAGETGLLCMIESYPAVGLVPLWQRIGINWRVGRMRILEKLKGKKNDLQTTRLVLATEEMQPVRACDYIALAKYEPRPYKDKVYFVKARKSMHFPDKPEAVWGKLIPNMKIETVSGDHHEVLGKHFVELAAVLSRYIQETN